MNLIVPYADVFLLSCAPHDQHQAPGNGSADQSRAVRLDDHYGFHPALRPMLPLYENGGSRSCRVWELKDNDTGSHFECQDRWSNGDSAHGLSAAVDGSEDSSARGRTERPGRSAPSPSARRCRSRSAARRGERHAVALPTSRLKRPPAIRSWPRRFWRSSTGLTVTPARRAGARHAEDVRTRPGFAGGTTTNRPMMRFIRRTTTAAACARSPGSSKRASGSKVACVDLGGWDTHFVQGSTEGFHASNARALAEGLAAFDADIKESRKDVTVLVDDRIRPAHLPRTVRSHRSRPRIAAMVLSERIRGGRVIGHWPSVVEGNGDQRRRRETAGQSHRRHGDRARLPQRLRRGAAGSHGAGKNGHCVSRLHAGEGRLISLNHIPRRGIVRRIMTAEQKANSPKGCSLGCCSLILAIS